MASKAATKGEKVMAKCSYAPSLSIMSSRPCQGSKCVKAMKARPCFSTSAQTCSLQAAQRYLPPYSFLPVQVLSSSQNSTTQAVKECVSTSIGLPKCKLDWLSKHIKGQDHQIYCNQLSAFLGVSSQLEVLGALDRLHSLGLATLESR